MKYWSLPKGELLERQVKLNKTIFHNFLSFFCIFLSRYSALGQLDSQKHHFKIG